jgi:hypothetical protein
MFERWRQENFAGGIRRLRMPALRGDQLAHEFRNQPGRAAICAGWTGQTLTMLQRFVDSAAVAAEIERVRSLFGDAPGTSSGHGLRRPPHQPSNRDAETVCGLGISDSNFDVRRENSSL